MPRQIHSDQQPRKRHDLRGESELSGEEKRATHEACCPMNAQLTRRQVLQQGATALGMAAGVLPWNHPGRAHAAVVAPSQPVAIQRCDSYAPEVLFDRLRTALDSIGGISSLVRDKTVTVKLNLTGGPRWQLGGLPSYRTYHVHPQFVAAACAALDRGGARKIVLIESGYARESLEEVMTAGGWDLDHIQRAGGGKVTWEDSRNQGRWPSYSRLKVPWGGYLYPAFDLNSRYEKTDVFISLAKLKDHANAGITVAVKNLFGIAPTSIYGDNYDGAGRPAVEETCISARGHVAPGNPASACRCSAGSRREVISGVELSRASRYGGPVWCPACGSMSGGRNRNQSRRRGAVDSGSRAHSAPADLGGAQRSLHGRDLRRRDGL